MSDNRFCSNCNAELHEGELGHYMAPSMGEGGIWACEAFQKVVGEGVTPALDHARSVDGLDAPLEQGFEEMSEVTPPSPEAPTKLKMGFHVEIEMHNQESATTLNPEEIKTIIGAAFDKTGMFLEGVDFSLEVKRTYEQV